MVLDSDFSQFLTTPADTLPKQKMTIKMINFYVNSSEIISFKAKMLISKIIADLRDFNNLTHRDSFVQRWCETSINTLNSRKESQTQVE